jgi:tetratricopeptide (TPR) repeat protein
MLAEVWEFPGDRRPPDPSGHLGYFVVAVYPDEAGEGEPTFLDPWGGHETQPDADHSRVLSDPQAAAALANTSALYTLVHENDPTHALESAQMALSLDARAPYIRGVRASVLISSGGPQEGLDELRAAADIRDDAPRHNNLAGVFMAQRDFDGASREIAASLESAPDYAAAHATLAAIHLEQGETDEGRAELETAQRLDPDLFNLPMIWASYYLRTGDTREAARRAHEAVEKRGFDWQTRLSAAQVFHAAGLYDDMRRQTRRVLELAPESQRAGLREMILQVLGSTALDEPFDEEDESTWAADGEDSLGHEEDDLGADALPSPDFQLGGGGGLLGGGDNSGDSPSLLGGGMNEPLLQLGDPSKIRLRGPSGGLHLDLGN